MNNEVRLERERNNGISRSVFLSSLTTTPA
jgi:hypothetical protein